MRAARERDARALALLAREQVEHRAAEQRGVAPAGRERGRPALAQPPRDRRAHVARPGPEKYCAAPSSSHAQRSQRAKLRGPNGGGMPRVVGGDVAAREQRRRREHQQLERALDVRRALREQPRREHVQLALAGPADEVAASRRRRQPPLERQPGLGGVELRGRAVHDDGELAEPLREALVEPRAGVLELGEHALDVGRVALVVARDEASSGGGLEPGQPCTRRRRLAAVPAQA